MFTNQISTTHTATMAVVNRRHSSCMFHSIIVLIAAVSSTIVMEQVESFPIASLPKTRTMKMNPHDGMTKQKQTKTATLTTAFLYIDPESPQTSSGIPASQQPQKKTKEQQEQEQKQLSKNLSQPHSIQQHSARTSSSSLSSSSTGTSRRGRQVQKQQNVIAINNAQDYQSTVLQQTDRIVVVRYHSSYCKACQQIAVAYGRLAKQYSPKGVKFVDIAMDAPPAAAAKSSSTNTVTAAPTNNNNVDSTSSSQEHFVDNPPPGVPFGRIYFKGTGLVEEIPIARRHFSKFKKVLGWYVKSECDIPDDFFENPHETYDNENLIL
mmetsp:Transcript_13096/g.18544  ORF Transcript_13096/g.18544 Transcript_13096/m.18544 type:complete len:322 (+) Transcript_13096:302-1267(+)